MNRRSFLKGAGAVTVVVSGGAVWRAYDRGVFSVGEGPAYEPWKDWRTSANDGPLALVRAAILAANPFNTQPWLFKVTDSLIELYADNPRNTGAFDPFLRELRIGLGCALENLVVAARPNGYNASVTVLPGKLAANAARPDRELVAAIELTPGRREENELYNAIPQRHTNRYPYDPQRPIPPEFITDASHLVRDEPDVKVFLFTTDDDRRKVAAICAQSAIEDSSYSDLRTGTTRWIREDWRAVQKQRDGAYIDDLGLPPLEVALQKFLPEKVLEWRQASRPKFTVDQIKGSYSDLMMTGRVSGLIAVRDRYDQPQSVTAGRIWQRAHLLATARGLAARPANQAVQLMDYQNVHGKEPHAAQSLAEVTGDPAWQPTFMFYMGYATREAKPTARRPAQDVVI